MRLRAVEYAVLKLRRSIWKFEIFMTKGSPWPVEERPWRRAYNSHRYNAKRRGCEFLLTFQEWRALWEASGQFSKRGNRKGCFVMARNGDKGPYALGNVRIIRHEENIREQWARPETLVLIRKALVGNTYAKGYTHTEQACLKMRGNKNGIGNKSRTGQKATPEQRKKLSLAQIARWARAKASHQSGTSS